YGPLAPPPAGYIPSSPPAFQPPQSPEYGAQDPRWRPQYEEPIPDMGTSLGYGQGTEYQFFEPPQPSQPMARLRQERLQQLREKRMRNQQQRLGNVTSMIGAGEKQGKSFPSNATPLTPVPPQPAPSWGANAPPSMIPRTPPSPPTQLSPRLA